MSKFVAFMKNNTVNKSVKEVIISDRFKDNQGEIIPFKIKGVSAKTESLVRNKYMIMKDGKPDFDADGYNREFYPLCIVYPDLNDKELQDSYGVMNSGDLLEEMLLSGEYHKLIEEISKHNGYKTYTEKVKEVKN